MVAANSVPPSLHPSLSPADDGEAFTTGANDDGQLGTNLKAEAAQPSQQQPRSLSGLTPGGGGSGSSSLPVRVKALDLYKVQHAAAGQSHMLTVTQLVRCAYTEGACG